MNKILFFFSNILTVIGICILFITHILNKVFPIMGQVAFQAAMAGSYTPDSYKVNFTIINLFAILLMFVGVATAYIIYKKGHILS